MFFNVVGSAVFKEKSSKELFFLIIFLLQLLSILFIFTLKANAENVVTSIDGQFLIKFSKTLQSNSSNSRSAMRSELGVKKVKSFEINGAELVEAENGTTIDDQYAKELLASGAIEYIEPNYIVSIDSTPNDTRFSELWGMNNTGQTGGTANIDIDAPEAWNLSTGSNTVVVGVVDTGIDYTHPDLENNMWVNPGEIAGNGVDDDHNGVVDDIYGYNAYANNGNPLDDNNHGTHCAGTIGGAGNNSKGVAGVSWNVKLMALKFLSSSGSGSTSDAIEAIQYAVTMKNAGVNIKVLSNSWGGGGFSQSLEDAISQANSAGILFIAAAGNSASNNDSTPTYPANYNVSNVISVAAIDHNGALASFSSYGANTVDLAAPGVSILSTVPGNSYASYSGTSMATPHVSGVAGLLAAYAPTLSAPQLKERLLTTVKTISGLNGSIKYPGTVDAYNALTNTTSLPPSSEGISYAKSGISISYDTSLGERVLTSDDGYYTKDLGFNFDYYDTSYTRIAISSNGRLVPLTASDTQPTENDYSNRIATGIYPLNDDLYPSPVSSDGGVWFKTENNVATITWVVVPYAFRAANNVQTELRFQAKLYSTGKIEFHYLDNQVGDTGYDYGSSASVGLAPLTSGEKLTVTNNASNETEIGNNKALSFQIEGSHLTADFDGDGKSDFVVWRPSNGTWYVLTSSSNYNPSEMLSYKLGESGYTPLIGDFDGDAKEDIAVYNKNSGYWDFLFSNNSYSSQTSKKWGGSSGDTPVVGKYDSDDAFDIGYYNIRKGFFIYSSANGYSTNKKGKVKASSTLKGSGTSPLSADFNGDGVDDYAIVAGKKAKWTARTTGGSKILNSTWGRKGDKPLACDWDNNGVSDQVQVRSENGSLTWIVKSNTNATYSEVFGSAGGIPSCNHDYDGDGKIDPTVFSSGSWSYKSSATGETNTVNFGLDGDIPL